ncbi:helix-turn-helix domain-containing protein [Sunxiuqinia sp. A32]|uniref:helix-turn-helix domain-containing protein n=1 Tax=Sunxiuqinia sp. A32 TaxID=3461496 RepID=UPI004045983D
MIYLSQNIKYLRKIRGWTQQHLADKLGVKRALVGAYEEGRATPKLFVLQKLAEVFSRSVDDIIGNDLSAGIDQNTYKKDLQILPILVDQDNNERIPIVPVKASAGYLNGLADPEFIEKLPRFSIPIPELSKERTYRVFQIKGDSMLPVNSGAYIFCEFVEHAQDIIDGQTYVLITLDEGLVYKRVFKKVKNVLLKSDNSEYTPYEIATTSVVEIWKAKGILSFELPEPGTADLRSITNLLAEVKDEIKQLKR